jgi:hypothetical protein
MVVKSGKINWEEVKSGKILRGVSKFIIHFPLKKDKK